MYDYLTKNALIHYAAFKNPILQMVIIYGGTQAYYN